MMHQNTQQGFTLFIAVLLGSLMLAIGFSIFNLAFKELLLSSSSRDSQVAFYAADTGLECALYYDQQQRAFQTGQAGGPTIQCAGITVSAQRTSSSNPHTWQFALDTPGLCTVVEVQKSTSDNRTLIRAFGYNTCDSTDERRTERGLRVIYRGL